jgi:hypothetical protein
MARKVDIKLFERMKNGSRRHVMTFHGGGRTKADARSSAKRSLRNYLKNPAPPIFLVEKIKTRPGEYTLVLKQPSGKYLSSEEFGGSARQTIAVRKGKVVGE